MKPRSVVWRYFEETKEGSTVKGKCRNCLASYVTNATRMANHILRCTKAPSTAKESCLPLASQEMAKKYRRPRQAQQAPEARAAETQDTADSDVEVINDIDQPSSSAGCSSTSGSDANAKQASQPERKPTITKFLDAMTTGEKSKLNGLLSKAIYASNTPFNIVENDYWKDFFKALRPSYDLPSRYEIANPLLDDSYKQTEEKVQEKVTGGNKVVIISDGWSNIRNESIINIILATPEPVFYKYIDASQNSHTAVYISSLFNGIIQELGPERVSAVVTDGAANMVAAHKLVKEQESQSHIQTVICGAHNFHLVARDMEELHNLNQHISSCKEIVKFFKYKHIPSATLREKKREEEVNQGLVLPAPTRWGSVYYMFDRLMTNRKALQSAVVDDDVSGIIQRGMKDNILDNEVFWVRTEKYASILKPILDALRRVEGDAATLADLIDAYSKMKKSILEQLPTSPFNKREEEGIKKVLNSRLDRVMTNAHRAAHLLHPNYTKDADPEQMEGAFELIVQLTTSSRDDQGKIMAEIANFRAKDGKYKSSFLWNAAKEVEKGKLKASTWWSGMLSHSILAESAQALLTIPPSSAASERNFSAWSTVHTKKRNRLTTQRAGKLVYIYHNLRMLKNIKDGEEKDGEDENEENEEDVDIEG